MTTKPTLKQPRTWLVSAALLLTLAGVFVARTAFARILSNTIDPIGIVSDNGRQVTVTGPIAVTAGERTELRVTVTQRSSGAVAEGIIFFTGTGQTNQWKSPRRPRAARHFRLGRPRWSDWRAAALAGGPPMRISGWWT